MDSSLRPTDEHIARDGSPVDVYDRWLPAMGEAELVHDATRSDACVLELGSGAGRVTRRLVALGHPVVAVDDSQAMLERIPKGPGVETRCASIDDLNLGRAFEAVILGSHLVNTADEPRRRAFLRTCRRHLSDDGRVFIERMDPRWADPTWALEKASRPGHIGEVTVTSHALRLDSPYLTQSTDYTLPDGRRWRQGPYTMLVLDDSTLERELGFCALELDRWLPWRGTRRIWCTARRA